MSKETTAAAQAATRAAFPRLSFIPFTSGIIIAVYAWFWPEGYGRWLGTIVHGFRSAAGF